LIKSAGEIKRKFAKVIFSADMALKSVVKVGRLSNLSDARFCSGVGVELLGFSVIEGNDYYMSPAVFHDIRGWIAGPKIAAELYGVTSGSQIIEAREAYAPDYFEVPWEVYLSYRDALTLPCIVYASAEALDALRSSDSDEKIKYVMIDGTTGCASITGLSYPVLKKVTSEAQLRSDIAAGCFQGYALDAPRQEKAGITSYEELGSLLEILEDD